MSKYLIKLHAFIYRLTGYHSDYLKIKEYEHILKRLPEIEKELFRQQTLEDSYSLNSLVSIEIGMWQARNGVYRPLSKRWLKKYLD